MFDGNSLTNGAGASAGQSYRDQVLALVSGWTQFNASGNGFSIAEMNVDAATQVDSQYDAGRAKNVVVFWEGRNQIVYSDDDATAIFNKFKQYGEARKAAGWKTIVLTTLPSAFGNEPEYYETRRQAFNAILRERWDEVADVLVDVADDSRIGLVGCTSDATYYADGVHMTAAGYAIIAARVAVALAAI